MRFNKYYFENYSSDTPFDINNPRFVMAMDGVDSVLERIVTSAPYSLTTGDFGHADLLNALLNIDVLQIKDGHLGIAVPFFFEPGRGCPEGIEQKGREHHRGGITRAQRADSGHYKSD